MGIISTRDVNLKSKDDNDEDPIGSEKHPVLLDSPAVAEEGNDEDESSKSKNNISSLFYYCRLNKLLDKASKF